MDDQARRLVNDDEGFVFVDDFNGNRLGSKTGRSRRNQFDFQFVVFAQLVGGFRGFAVYENVFRFDEALEPGAAPTFNSSS